jgi:hypothetical protein
MAKTPNEPEEPKKPKPATRDQVAAAVAALRDFRKSGASSWERVQAIPCATGRTARPTKAKSAAEPQGDVHGTKMGALKAAAAEAGKNYDTLKKGWRVSAEYTAEQIEALCGLVAKHKARFGPTHLSRLLAVGDRKRRDALTREAIRGRWGVARVERAVQAANGGRRGHVGKRPSVTTSEPELLAALHALCDTWTRWCADAAGSIPNEVKEAVEEAAAAIETLKTKVAAKLATYAPPED